MVEVVWSGVLSAWRREGNVELWLLLRTDPAPDPDLLTDLINQTNDELTGADGDPEIEAGYAGTIKTGHIIFVHRTWGDEAALKAWCDLLATKLTNHGLTGKLTSAPKPRIPEWFAARDGDLTAFVSYQQLKYVPLAGRSGGRHSGWNTDPALTNQLTTYATNWAHFPGAHTYLTRDTVTVRADHLNAAPLITNTLNQSTPNNVHTARICCITAKPGRGTTCAFSINGQACYTISDPQQAWQNRIQQLTQILTAFPQQTDLGLIRHSFALASAWHNIDSTPPRLPNHLDRQDLEWRRMLLLHYVPDAHGIQLLTPQHLDKAHDLADWNTQQLTPNRYLLTSKQPEAWYATPNIHPDTLAKARQDFGQMILTQNTLDEHDLPPT